MEFVQKLNSMSLNDFLIYYKKLSEEERKSVVCCKNLVNLDSDKFNIIVLNLNEETAKIILSNEALYDKILNLPFKSKKRTFLNILEEANIDVLKMIIESEYSYKYYSKFKEFISFLSGEKLNKISSFDYSNLLKNILDKSKLRDYLLEKFDSKDEYFNNIFELFISKINNKKLNLMYILKIENYKQFVLFSKFGLLIEVQNEFPDIVLPTGTVIPYEKIIDVKDKYITKLIELLKQKGNASDFEYLEVALKLYFVFGFDNSKKIIEDKFSQLNDSSLNRIVDFTFKDSRREYRAKNQDKFYFYGMEQKIIDSISSNNNEIFKNLLFEPNLSDIEALRKEFLLLMYEYDGKEELREKIKDKLCEKINKREELAKKKLYNSIKNRIDEKINNSNKVDTKCLFALLKNVNLNLFFNEYTSIEKESLNSFLLGNFKVNNDCLFRLILNKEAFGLNDNLSSLINNFKLLTTVSKQSKLSLNSVLDIIDILKMDLYELRPNEQDITLETLTRIINSTEYIIDNGIDVAKETCRIHVERKDKVFSTIPTVEGTTEYFEYFVAPFDAEYLLAAGNDAKNCFRVSALGQDFFEYCLKNKNAVIIYLKDNSGKKYVCPTIRSGNAINCNGIDPKIEPGKEKFVLQALSECFKKIINASFFKDRNHYENIEIATVTDLHLKDYLSETNISKYNLEKAIPLDKSCYSDYNKEEITHYVLAKSKTYNKNYYYISNDKFYQNRDQDYEFDVNKEYDKEKLSSIINSIYYSSIDYQNISPKEKNRRKRYFKPLNIDSFKYITGNKDWFVAIDDNYNIISCLLPYDIRAKKNYIDSLSKAPILLEQLIGDNYVRKNI